MDDDLYPRAIRRAFARYELSSEATLTAGHGTKAPVVGASRFAGLTRLAMPLGVAAAVAAVLVATTAPARPAFASWQPTPASADAAVVASARDGCTSSDPDHLTGLRLVASEQRGDYTMLLFGDGAAYGLCLTGSDTNPMVLAGPGSAAVDAPAEPAPWGEGHGDGNGSEAVGVRFVAQPGSGSAIAERLQTWVVGVTPEVARVVFERADAEPVIASLGEEVAFAWWPVGAEAVAIATYDAGGDLLQRIPVEDFAAH
ncbi:MAG: hypothetical protein H0X16_09735 [Chloroflexi bacterium]|nr:hypothetical protein [Chloroflexota bacterium]